MDDRRYAPATLRNRQAILEVLQQFLPPQGVVLEVASGTGEHGVFFAPQLAPRSWLPSDMSREALTSIRAWRQHMPCPFLLEPIELDIRSGNLAHPLKEKITAIVNINMIHIAPWSACEGLMTTAQKILPSGGILYLYGPFRRGGNHTAPSNAAFDQSLQQQNPDWGVRNLEDVSDLAARHQLSLAEIVEMPANNLSVLFKKVA
ncbi:MAG: SAM-dependent methyltransferase [Cyanobacteria bacterium M5B4]|nr:MAG: SAM-dependent methyltransferase [Cyanobacteria bacterium M5B4]